MTTIEILENHQSWRRGQTDKMFNTSKEIGEAIDDAIAALKERDIARKAAVSMAGEIQRFKDGMAKASGVLAMPTAANGLAGFNQ